jgi:hypothetical protein
VALLDCAGTGGKRDGGGGDDLSSLGLSRC